MIRGIAKALEGEDWPLIDLSLDQFGFPPADQWRGTKAEYLLQPTYTASGKINGALTFNGTTDKINIADNAALRLSSFTLAGWVNLTATRPAGKEMVII